MAAFRTLDDVDVSAKRVLVRVDLNVPVKEGAVSDDTRLRAVAPTINELADKGAKVILLAHFGRPKGKKDPSQSLEPIVPALAKVLGRPVAFAADCIGPVAAESIANMVPGDVIVLENTRFYKGEEENDAAFTRELAANGDLYVNDAFSAAHRAHASTEGLARILPAVAGRTMQAELVALSKALGTPVRPVMAVVGGAKVSSKIDLLENLVGKVDALVIGGGMANTFLAAQGFAVGKSLCEHDLAPTAVKILAAAEKSGCKILLPVDVVVSEAFKANAPHVVTGIDAVPEAGMILDAGPKTVEAVAAQIAASKTLVWNGPLGAFELEPFDAATVAAAKAAAAATLAGTLLSVAGGGDTVAALNHAGVAADFSYVSTAGGAFLEWLEGKALPGVVALEQA